MTAAPAFKSRSDSLDKVDLERENLPLGSLAALPARRTSDDDVSGGVAQAEEAKYADTRPVDDKLDPELDSKAAAYLPGQAPTDFPDGGRVAWTVVFGAFCGTAVSFGLLNTFGTFVSQYKTQLPNSSSGAIALIGSIQLFGLFFIGFAVGKKFDQGYLRSIIGISSITVFVCFFLLSFCTQYWQILLSQGFGMGFGMGGLFIPSLSCISHYFRRKRSLAMGIASTGSSLGGIVLAIQLRRQFVTVGFPWAVRTSAFICLALLAAANLCLRTRLPPKRGGKVVDFSVYRDKPYAVWCGANFAIFLGVYTPLFQLGAFALDHGVDPDLAFYSIAIAQAGSIVGRLLPMWLADRIGILQVLIPCTALCIPLIFIWLACTTEASTIVFAILYGFTSGAFVSGVPAATATLTPDISRVGTYSGMQFFSCSLAGLAGSPIAGALAGRSYAASAGFSGGFVTIGVALIIYARHLHIAQVRLRETG